MSKHIVLFLMIFLMLLSGCQSAAATQSAMPLAAPGEANFGAPASDGFGAGRERESAKDLESQSQSEPGANRLVIRNANLTIVVADPAQAVTTVIHMAEEMDGFVVSSNLYKTTSRSGQEYPEANITVRVPAERLNEALAQIKALVKDPEKDILAENVSGQDVTKEYTDLQSRLTNLQNTEAQLREIQASATKTEDVLAVYNQLTQVREEIEIIQGQIQYYKESAAMSAIAVQIKALDSIQPLEIGGWRPAGVARDAAQALIDTLQFLGSAAIWLIIFFVPIGLVIFLPLRFLWWLFRRNRKPKLQAPPPQPPAPQNPT